ncbi:ScyD/ScyE family protein [Isoptericola sp. S6320L]|uniref:ScyD/ScyE family protein n=1 Tax=Isoptericola sp. S6320L TaxID=2926411 RepID=UPI001FF29DC6|nr:ScyD/ScyE family protein [Isoptericola sp. S6320L]MCK0117559.1 ScyD/ScyE family protein [Isoptericola sp. S6320L]
MRRTLSSCAAVVAALVLAATPAAAHGSHDPRPPSSTTIASGLVTPLSLAVGPRGTTFVSQNFAGLLTAVDRRGEASVLYASDDGAEVGGLSYTHRTVTFAETGATQTVKQLHLDKRGNPRGEPTVLADVGAYEAAKNPDGGVTYGFRTVPESCLADVPPEIPAQYTGIVESHPYATTTTHRGTTYVADAAANAILSVDHRGKVRTAAVLPAQPVRITAAAAEAQGLPSCVVGHKYWFEPVPTDVEVGPFGLLYVSLLPGGPEDDSLGARGSVVVVSPWNGRAHTVADDLLSPTGIAVDKKGTVYVAQLFGGEISKVGRHGATEVVSVPLPGDVELDGRDLLATVNVLPPDETSPPDGQLVRYSLSGRR